MRHRSCGTQYIATAALQSMFIRVVKRRSRSFMKCKSMLATVLICACGGGCAPERVEEATDTVTLPGGAVLTNTTYVTLEDHRIRHNELSYQEHASAGTETIGHLMDFMPVRRCRSAIQSLACIRPAIARPRARSVCAPAMDAKDGPYWYRVETNPDQVASVFLRSFMKAGDARCRYASSERERGLQGLWCSYRIRVRSL